MKNYNLPIPHYRIAECKYHKYYYDKDDLVHRLDGPAIESISGQSYCIHNINYIDYFSNNNECIFYYKLTFLIPKYEIYIKQNIKELIKKYNPKFKFSFLIKKEEINAFPNWIKDLIIL